MSEEIWTNPGPMRWDHVHLNDPGRAWLETQSLERWAMQALVAEDTRPRVTVFGKSVVLVLRGVNLNAGQEAEDMVSIRIWSDGTRVISVWLRPLRAVSALQDMAEDLDGPGELISRLAFGLTETAGPVIAGLGDRVDALEEAMIDPTRDPDPVDLSDLRRKVIVFRRYFSPQSAAMEQLAGLDADWVNARDHQRLTEAADRVARLGEDIDALGQRGQVLQDHQDAQRSDHMNRQMFVLSIVAALFLPLGFITGLLGVNLGGIPGSENGAAFWILCAALAGLGVVQWLVFRALGIGRTRR